MKTIHLASDDMAVYQPIAKEKGKRSMVMAHHVRDPHPVCGRRIRFLTRWVVVSQSVKSSQGGTDPSDMRIFMAVVIFSSCSEVPKRMAVSPRLGFQLGFHSKGCFSHIYVHFLFVRTLHLRYGLGWCLAGMGWFGNGNCLCNLSLIHKINVGFV